MARAKPTPSSPRRVGASTSKTRVALLDSVERLMLEEGYASVTYRALAAKAGVTPALVQYYFPKLDDVFIAAIRRRVESNLGRLETALQERSDEPLRVMWEFSRDEATAALMTEFTALGNHRKTIKAEIAQVMEKVRQIQLAAVMSIPAAGREFNGEFSPPALLFLLTGIPKLLNLEADVGVSTAHDEVADAFERFLDAVEPRPRRATRRQSS